MRKRNQKNGADNTDRRTDQNRRALGGLRHHGTPDQHTDQLGDDQRRHQIRHIVILVPVDDIIHIIDRHAGNEIHAALTGQIDADKKPERTAPEGAGRVIEAVRQL